MLNLKRLPFLVALERNQRVSSFRRTKTLIHAKLAPLELSLLHASGGNRTPGRCLEGVYVTTTPLKLVFPHRDSNAGLQIQSLM